MLYFDLIAIHNALGADVYELSVYYATIHDLTGSGERGFTSFHFEFVSHGIELVEIESANPNNVVLLV